MSEYDDEVDLDEGWGEDDGEETGLLDVVYCRHWADARECQLKCGMCGHGCTDHGTMNNKDDPCSAEGCECDEWVDPGDVEDPVDDEEAI